MRGFKALMTKLLNEPERARNAYEQVAQDSQEALEARQLRAVIKLLESIDVEDIKPSIRAHMAKVARARLLTVMDEVRAQNAKPK